MPDRRLKILFITPWYPSAENPAFGIFVREHALAVALHHDVAVIHAAPDNSLGGLMTWRAEESVEQGIRTIRIRYGGRLARLSSGVFGQGIQGRSVLAAAHKLIKQGWRPELIHVHVYSAGVPAVLLARRLRIPLIITEQWTGFPRRLLSVFGRMKARWIMNNADLISPVSDDLKGQIQAHGVKGPFEVFDNTVDTELFHPSTEPRANDGVCSMVMVAMLHQVKGVEYLLRSLAEIKPQRPAFHLEIIGDGVERRNYERLAEELGLAKEVQFRGLQPKQEIAEAMRRSDFFVLPSLWECLPCVVVEALASGLPVVACDVGGVREMLDSSSGLLVRPADVASLRGALEQMMEKYGDYDRAAIAEKARRRFGREAVGTKIDEIYQQLLRRTG